MAASCAINPEINGIVPPYAKKLLDNMQREDAFALCDDITKLHNSNPYIFLTDENGVPTLESIRHYYDLSSIIANSNPTIQQQIKWVRSLNYITLTNKIPSFDANGIEIFGRTDINSNGDVFAEVGENRREDYFFDAINDIGVSLETISVFDDVIKDCTSKIEAAEAIYDLIVNESTRDKYRSHGFVSNLDTDLDHLIEKGVLDFLDDKTYTSLSNIGHDVNYGAFEKEHVRGSDVEKINKVLEQLKEKMNQLPKANVTSLGNTLKTIYQLSVLKQQFNELNGLTDEQQQVYDMIEQKLGDYVFNYLRRQANIGQYIFDEEEKTTIKYDKNGNPIEVKHKDKSWVEKNTMFNIGESINDVRYNGNNKSMVLTTILAKLVRRIELESGPAVANIKKDVIDIINSGDKIEAFINDRGRLEFDIPDSVDKIFMKHVGIATYQTPLLIGGEVKEQNITKWLFDDNNHVFTLNKNTREFRDLVKESGGRIKLDEIQVAKLIEGTLANMYQTDLTQTCESFEHLNVVNDTKVSEILKYIKGENRSTGNLSKAVNHFLSAYSYVALGFNYTSGILNTFQGLLNGLIMSSGVDSSSKFAKNFVKSFASIIPNKDLNQEPSTIADYARLMYKDSDTDFGLTKRNSKLNKWGFAFLSTSEKIVRTSTALTVLQRKNIDIDGKRYSFEDLTKKYKYNDTVPSFKINDQVFDSMTMKEIAEHLSVTVDAMCNSVSGFSSRMFAPVASKTTLGKALLMMRRWMVALFNARYGNSRYRNELGFESAGYIRQTAMAVWDSIKNKRNAFGDPVNKAALRMTATELAIVGTMTALILAIDLDDDDDEKDIPDHVKIMIGGMFRDATSLAPTPLIYQSAKDVLVDPLPSASWGERFIKDMLDLKFYKQVPLIKQIYQWPNSEKRATFIMTQQREKLIHNSIIPGRIAKANKNARNARKESASKNRRYYNDDSNKVQQTSYKA